MIAALGEEHVAADREIMPDLAALQFRDDEPPGVAAAVEVADRLDVARLKEELGTQDGLIAGDRDVFGADRSIMLRDFSKRDGALALAHKSGSAMIRPGRNAAQVGPLLAQTLDDARGLLRATLAAVRGRVFGFFITIGGLVGNMSHWVAGRWVQQLGPAANAPQGFYHLYS